MQIRLLEGLFISLILAYFFIYPRDTFSDFIACSSFCALLARYGTTIGLQPIPKKSIGKIDLLLLLFTLSCFGAAWFYGYWHKKLNLNTVWTALVITITYFYYAFIQHFLAQRYLSVKMYMFVKNYTTTFILIKTTLLATIIFGLVHIPYPHLLLPSMFIGSIYSYYYLRTGRLWAIVVSHAIVSSSLLYWVLDDNPFTELEDFGAWLSSYSKLN